MRKLFLLTLTLFLTFYGFAQQTVKVDLKPHKSGFEVSNIRSAGFNVSMELAEISFTEKVTKEGTFTVPEAEGLIKTYNVGKPNLPVFGKLIEVPVGADVSFKVISFEEETIKLPAYGILHKIIPAIASVSKSGDFADVKYTTDKSIYEKNTFYSTEFIKYEEAGIMRHTRLGRIEVNPFQYNPVTNELTVKSKIQFEVIFKNADTYKTSSLKKKFYSPYYSGILKNQTINYVETDSKELIQDAPVTYVIVADRMFEAQLQEFIAWKKIKGFHVIVGYTDVIGTTTTTIKTYLQNLYENPTAGVYPPSFVLFVGDVQQVPTFTSSVTATHVTDLRYCEYTNDNIPEVYYGRFSAQTTAQLQPQIDKTLMYEQYTMPDPSYLTNQVLVAGVDAGAAPTFGNGAINYVTAYYVNAEHGINPLTYLYNDAANSTVMTSNNSGASASIISYISQGVGFANYTAHCSSSGWYDPSFDIEDVSGLTNNGKYGLWIGNCCQSVMFGYDECFGEAALRKVNGGAVGDIGGSESTYWDEDYWWGIGLKSGSATANPTYEETGLGAYDGVYHEKANEINNLSSWYFTQGQVNMCGNLAVQASTSGLKQYYWEIYHLMGDPSVMTYMRVPDALTVTTSPEVLTIGQLSVEITTTPYAYIAITQNEVLIGVGMVDAAGSATIDLSEAFDGTTVTMVVTAQNKQPFIEEFIPIALNQPYVLVNSATPVSSPEYGATTFLSVSLKNVAAEGSGYDASSVNAVISSSDEYVTINENTAVFGAINAGQIVTISDIFNITIDENTPDQHKIFFDVVMTGADAKYTWNSSFYITVKSPDLSLELSEIMDNSSEVSFISTPVLTVSPQANYVYNVEVIGNTGNGNGRLDAGETATVSVNLKNSGHAALSNATGTLSSTSPYVTIGSEPVTILNLPVGQTTPVTFSIILSPETPMGEMIDLKFTFVKGELIYEYTFEEKVGLILDDFESGDFSSYDWVMSGVNWVISSVSPYNGAYSAVSGNVNDNQISSMSLTLNVLANDQVSFFSKVSSESGYDYLVFYIDGTEAGSWSGEEVWAEHTYAVTAGTHTFKWSYEKDYSVSNGSDCAWVDNIILPTFSSKKEANLSCTISAITLPEWLTLTDNGNGTAVLSGLAPNTKNTYSVSLQAVSDGDPTVQNFDIWVGNVSVENITDNFDIYPNPNRGVFTIVLTESTSSSVEIYNIQGQIIYQDKLVDKNSEINLSNIAEGVYFVKISSDEQVVTKKLIIR